MSKREVATALMELPARERREVLEIGLASLESTSDPARVLASWFEGPSIEMTEARWKELKSRKLDDAALDRPLGAAVPPEHCGRTLREILAERES